MSSEFLTVYPGVYLPEEKKAMQNYRAQLDALNNCLVVTEKHIADGEHLVDIVWWCETLDGQIFTEDTATVSLPSGNRT